MKKLHREVLRWVLIGIFAGCLFIIQHVTFAHHILPDQSVAPVVSSITDLGKLLSVLATLSLLGLFSMKS
ncbi:hypothetical protein GCM10023189_06810 [Nibrella saemangeumensis]|uniref:Uncharacterized protein n=1 Tax=Nibrella saemangeumensis TaxID=1084526 RepID=A0ABP8MEI4_9BACT